MKLREVLYTSTMPESPWSAMAQPQMEASATLPMEG